MRAQARSLGGRGGLSMGVSGICAASWVPARSYTCLLPLVPRKCFECPARPAAGQLGAERGARRRLCLPRRALGIREGRFLARFHKTAAHPCGLGVRRRRAPHVLDATRGFLEPWQGRGAQPFPTRTGLGIAGRQALRVACSRLHRPVPAALYPAMAASMRVIEGRAPGLGPDGAGKLQVTRHRRPGRPCSSPVGSCCAGARR